jgi:tripartite-type tricarboxylate transporter receptor subunit TctC
MSRSTTAAVACAAVIRHRPTALRAAIIAAFGSTLLFGALPSAHAQPAPGAYPVKPIRLILGFAPGGPADLTARAIAPEMSQLLGQPILIENRGGAGGTIGTEVVVRAAPDGYTLTLGSQSSFTLAPWLYKNIYDPLKDLTPVSSVVVTPYVLTIHPRVPARTVQDLIRLGKGKKNFLTYGTSGPGATSHVAGELFAGSTGLQLLPVAFKGTGPAIAGVVGGEIDMMIADLGPVLGHAKEGRLRMLANVGGKRSQAAPDVPTLIEQGMKLPVLEGRFGILGPAGLPRDIVSRLHQTVVKIVAMPQVRQRFSALGYDGVGDTPEQYAETIRTELKLFGDVIRKAGITAN